MIEFDDGGIFWDVKDDEITRLGGILDTPFWVEGTWQLFYNCSSWRRVIDNRCVLPRPTDREYANFVGRGKGLPLRFFETEERFVTFHDKCLREIIRKCSSIILSQPQYGETKYDIAGIREQMARCSGFLGQEMWQSWASYCAFLNTLLEKFANMTDTELTANGLA